MREPVKIDGGNSLSTAWTAPLFESPIRMKTALTLA